ncbi:uncharacterized protein SCHCODRAFT_01038712 [Schizophyllum commune H4-8]|uniref:uncharacterized protein n=1 Tax=Schizophyllum commune (strain H4-8 / FGSC 9210) TaxID=578458 RepID=UPI00216025EE|nr:uncharacterized protein SCHCODRAFT_01038712 [Schizophyllum commune H4-8]KAI5891747.1 hypothetical protein SCHCODRAFT_01038712 [Schizophyllum commune H4-8]
MTTTLTLVSLLGSSPSSAFALAYALPLLFLSILLTFAGTFLTLDRTRSFPHPSYKAIPGSLDALKRRITFALEGGAGGLAIGYSFGVQFATFLAVCIPSLTSASPLSSKSFIAVWLLPSVVTTLLGGRWKYCALVFAGITGGATFALGISVIIHPNLLTRVVLTAILVPLSTILTLLPFERSQRPAMRFATASTGAFGVVMSIAILAGIPAWANVWQRLAEHDNIDWGTSKEQGLSAAFGILLCLGMGLGLPAQAQKWDGYLASYAANLPNQAGRAGTFQPLQSAWDRMLHGRRTPGEKEVIFPDEGFQDTKYSALSTPTSPTKLSKHALLSQHHTLPPQPQQSQFRLSPECLKKPRSQPKLRGFGRKPREAVKFRPFGKDISDSDEEGDVLDTPPPPARPWLQSRPSFSSAHTAATLVDDRELDAAAARVRIRNKLGTDSPVYSDYEEDVTMTAHGGSEEWRRASSGGGRTSSAAGHTSSSGGHSSATLTSPLGAVPATPSLIKAIDRIQQAQKVAFAPDGMPRVSDDAGKFSPAALGPGAPQRELVTPQQGLVTPQQGLVSPQQGLVTPQQGLVTPQKDHWDGFWKDVRDQARS